MKIACWLEDGARCVGVVDGSHVRKMRGINDVQTLILQGHKNCADVGLDGALIPLSTIQLIAPLTPQRNVLCVGWNYQLHFDEGAHNRSQSPVKELPSRPTFFSKATTSVNGPFDDIPLHSRSTQKLDWEVELALVIGRGGINISEADALDHVWGYTVVNDISARDLQQEHGAQWFKGKSLDGSCPMGPYLVTADVFQHPLELALECRVNGVVKQQSNTRHQAFPIPRLIAELSNGMTLLPGDIVLTGTPEGIGNARKPPEYLHEGDVVESFVEGIGTLRNVVRERHR